jgi:hypothetical protein
MLDEDREDPREVGYPRLICDYCKEGRHEGIACDSMVLMAQAILQMPKQCRGGAWGSASMCKYHEGLPIDPDTHLCVDGLELYGRSVK